MQKKPGDLTFAEAGTAYKHGDAKGRGGVTRTQGWKVSMMLVRGTLRRESDLARASVDQRAQLKG